MKHSSPCALILGGSSGLGLATAKKLAQHGFHLFIVHRDRRADLEGIEAAFTALRQNNISLHSFNMDALNREKRTAWLPTLKQLLGPARIGVLVHSIAKGNLKPLCRPDRPGLTHQDFQLTLEAMALSLYDWVQALAAADLFAPDTRVISFTSEGNTKAWENYAAVSAAKVALEALTRSMALEFAPLGIKANCIQAGVTDTKSLRAIPNSGALLKEALRRNPNGRLTTPGDVANAVYLLTRDEARWITGTVITVDGGESLR